MDFVYRLTFLKEGMNHPRFLQDSQFTYNVTLKGILATIVAQAKAMNITYCECVHF